MKRCLCFGKLRLDSDSGELFRDGRPVPLPPQPAKLLLRLVSSHGEIVTRKEIQSALWPDGAFVDFEQGISKCIKQVRAVLREEGDEAGYVQTVSKRGYRFVGSVAIEEQEPFAPSATERPRRLWWAAAGAVLLAIGGISLWLFEKSRDVPEIPRPRFQLSLPRGVGLPGFAEPVNMLAISSGGKKVAFVGCGNHPSGNIVDLWSCQLYLRNLWELDARSLPGTDGAMSPFFSPDGRAIAFGAGYQLKKVDLDHGTVVALATLSGVVRGGSWSEEGSILFGVNGRGLVRVSSEGGEVSEVTKPDADRKEFDHRWPQILPGGRAVLFEVLYQHGRYPGLNRGHDVAIVDFDRGESRVLLEGAGSPRYVDRHILFGRDGILYASSFDTERLELNGAPTPVLEGVAMWSSPGVARSSGGEVHYDVAKDGTLLYSPQEARLPERTLVLVDREGRRVWSSRSKRAYTRPFFSPDGRRIAVSVETDEGSRQAFVIELSRDGWTRVGGERNLAPMGWTPDGNHLLLYSGSGDPKLLLARADGSEFMQTLYVGTVLTVSAAPGGDLLMSATQPGRSLDLLRLRIAGQSEAEPWLATPGDRYTVSFSPDGRFVTFGSSDTGREETYVSAYSRPTWRRQVSTQGADLPRWSRDGKEIFFKNQGSLWSATVRTSPKFDSDPPQKLFDFKGIVSGFDSYDASPDGQLFAVVEADPFELRPLDVVVIPHFLEEMESRFAMAR